MSSGTSSSSSGIGISSLLTVAFVVLKLTHVINWKWFWVLSPTIFAAGIGLLILVVALIVVVRS